jgi:hypothetical protein
MKSIKNTLENWEESLCKSIALGGLYSRNPTAHKWKAPYRSMVLRETLFWRVTDTLNQTVFLGENNHHLGARILLRSAIETLGILIYLNLKTDSVLSGRENFDSFSQTTSKLLLGSKDSSTQIDSINILTVLKQSDKKYPGILNIYSTLCESAHPNYEGVCSGYSYIDHENDETFFKNRWQELHANALKTGIKICIETFEEEYDKTWPSYFNKLEIWLEENDQLLSQ